MKKNKHDLPAPKLLHDARVYLSGPMDFVASREEEKEHGWRTRVSGFLTRLGVTVFDPWNKPRVRGLHEYGREDEKTTKRREAWTFEGGKKGAKKRALVADSFWPALHIDLRMVDTSDFVIAYVPTNVYSVGTVHEIVLARTQRKPVLFVSPRVTFPTADELERHLKRQGDKAGLDLLARVRQEVPIKSNEKGAPSLWYLPLVGGEHFFDGFGFADYHPLFQGWGATALDEHERRHVPERPLLPFLEQLNEKLPEKWDRHLKEFGANDDWLLWELKEQGHGKVLSSVRGGRAGKSELPARTTTGR